MTRTLRRFLAALCGLSTVATLAIAFPQPAIAGTPQTYSNQAYDYTQATPWPPSGSTESIPYVNFTSHYATTMNTNTLYYHSPEIVNAYETDAGIQVNAGQLVGVICYYYDAQAHLFDKIDARFSGDPAANWNIPVSGSNLWIGYVVDTYVNLNTSDRLNYVPKCTGSYYSPTRSKRDFIYAIRKDI